MKTLRIIAGVALLSGILAGPTTAVGVETPASDPRERILDNYLEAQSALARDSLQNVSASAQAIVAAARSGDPTSQEIARHAEALAKAASLTQAREAFKPLSESVIGHLKATGFPPGIYYEMYCPTVKAEWLQKGEEAMNPYLGLRARTATWGWACPGVVKAKFGGPSEPLSQVRGTKELPVCPECKLVEVAVDTSRTDPDSTTGLFPSTRLEHTCPGCQGAVKTLFKEGKLKHKCSICAEKGHRCPASHRW